MRQYLEKIISYGLYLFVFLLPWQTRWIWHEGQLGGQAWEYGSFSLYATDIIFFMLLILSLFILNKKQKNLDSIWYIIFGFLFVSLLSIFWSQANDVSWYTFFKILEGVLLFWIIMRTKINWRYIGIAFVSAGAIQSLIGIFQFFNQKIIANKWLGLASHDAGVLGQSVIETGSGRWLRAYGALPHPNILAGFLIISIVIVIGLLISRQSSRKNYLITGVLSSIALGILSYGLILTFSRAAWLIIALIILIFIAISFWRRNRFHLRVAGVVVAALVLSAVSTALVVPDIWETRITGGRLEDISITERNEQYSQSFEVIKDYWYQGTGVGAYTKVLNNIKSGMPAWYYQPVHNIFIQSFAELGVFGGIIFLLIIWNFLKHTWQKYKLNDFNDWQLVFSLCFGTIILIGLFEHYLWSLSSGIFLFWVILALWNKSNKEGVDNF